MIEYYATVRLTRYKELILSVSAEDEETASEQLKQRAENNNPGWSAEVVDIVDPEGNHGISQG